MQTPILRVILLMGVLLFSGCASSGIKFDEANAHLLESARSYVDAADKALPGNPALAKTYTGYAREVLGPPGEDLSTEELEERHKRDAKVLAERQKAADRLIELGKIKEKENNANLVKRIWVWAVGIFGTFGAIALFACCPALAFGLLKGLISFIIWSIGKMPSLINSFGIVGKATIDNIVKGVGEVRNTLKTAPERTYTAQEVLAMLDGELKSSLDHSDKRIVETLRSKLNV